MASPEGRSTAQIYEVFLETGTNTYKKLKQVVEDFLTNIGKRTVGTG